MLVAVLYILAFFGVFALIAFLAKWSFAMLLSPFIVLSKVFTAETPEEKKKARKLLIAFLFALSMITLLIIVSIA